MATKQKHKIIALDSPIITTIVGFKEERTVHIMAEEAVYLRNKKIRLLSIDRLLEGDPPVSSAADIPKSWLIITVTEIPQS